MKTKKERQREASRRFYKKNKEKCQLATRKWRERNKEKYDAGRREYARLYRESKRKKLKRKGICMSCESLVVKNQVVCDWCLRTYPYLYKQCTKN